MAASSDATAKPAPVMDVRQISDMLPHRFPFLLVDRVISVDDEKIVALKNVTINEPFFGGHFPGMPVMPGVLIVEALAQAGALYAGRIVKFSAETHVIFFMAIDNVAFRKPVTPGDQLVLECVPLRKGGTIWKLRGEAKVDGAVVCEAEFLASIVDRKKA
mgnify:CR=1 FL=1